MRTGFIEFLRREYAPPAADAELLNRYVQHRDADAFAHIVRRHGPAILAVCRRQLLDLDVDDAFQAVFVTLARKAVRFRRPESLAAWLHGVALRICGNARRARRRRWNAETHAPIRTPPQPTQELTAREILTVLDDELQHLPEHERTPLLLVYWQGRTQAVAAQMLGLSAGALRGRLDRGRQRLADRLRSRGFAPGELRSLLVMPVAVTGVNADLLGQTLAITTGGATMSAAVATLAVAATSSITATALSGVFFVTFVTAAVWFAAKSDAPAVPIPTTSDFKSALRNDGDQLPLPDNAIRRLGSLRMKHPAAKWSTLLSQLLPDGRRALTWNQETLRVWDLEREKLLGEIRFANPPGFRALSHQGDLAAFEVQGAMIIVDLKEVRIRKELPSPGNVEPHQLRAAAFSPDHKHLAWYRDGELQWWDIDTAKQVDRFAGAFPCPQDLTFTPDGTTLVGVCLNEPNGRKAAIVRWDVKSRMPTTERPISATSPPPRLSRNGAWVAAPEFNPSRLAVMATTTGERRHVLPSPGFDFHFANDDCELVSIGWTQNEKEYQATVWSLEAGTPSRTFELGPHPGGGQSVSSDGRRLLFACLGPMVFDMTTGRWTKYGAGHRGPVDHIQYAPDGRRLLSTDSHSSIAWDCGNGEALGELSNQERVKIRSNNDAIVFGSDRAALVAFPHLSKELRSLKINYPSRRLNHSWRVSDIAVSQDGTRAAIHIASHPYPGVLNGTHHDFFHRWDLTSGKAEAPWAPPQGLSFTRFGPTSRYALGFTARSSSAGGSDTVDVVYEVGTGRERVANAVPLQLHLRHLLVSPNGHYIGTFGFVQTARDDNSRTGYHTFSLRELRTNQECLAIRWEGRDPHNLTFGMAGNGTLAFSMGSAFEIRDGLGELMATYSNGGSEIRTFEFRPDHQQLASGHSDGTVLLWNLPKQKVKFVTPDATTLNQWWEDLKSDPRTAYRAMGQLARHVDAATELLTKHVHPVPTELGQRVKQIVADLDSNSFQSRQAAAAELAKLADYFRPLLESLENQPIGPESKRVIKKILDQPVIVADIDSLRVLRTVELLERIGTFAAQELLTKLASGAEGHQVTHDAQESLRRLRR